MKQILLMTLMISVLSFATSAKEHSDPAIHATDSVEFSKSIDNSNSDGQVDFDDDCYYADKFCSKRPNYCRCMKINGSYCQAAKRCGFK